ncbi:IS30 family transposase, partial [Ligilactobacillus sp. LYQ135]
NYHYDASLAQALADQRQESKTLPRADKYTVKQGEVIADKILNHHWSPRAIAQRCPEVKVSHQTIYTWIKAGRIPNVSLMDLNNPLHERHNPKRLSDSMRKLKQQARKQQQQEGVEEQRVLARQRRILIEKRPKTINQRKYFGHWEVDCVVPRRGGRKVIVTFAERKTRYYQCFIAEQ